MKTFMNILFDVVVKTAVKAVGIVMLLAILIQIFSRTVSAVPYPWTDELARGTFIWFCFLGSAMAMRQYAHLGIDYFRSKLTKNGQLISDMVVAVAVIAFGVLMAYLGWKMLGIIGRQRTPIMRISMQWFFVVVPISGALMAVQGVEFLLHYIKTREPRQLVEEIAIPKTDEPLI